MEDSNGRYIGRCSSGTGGKMGSFLAREAVKFQG